MLVLKIREGVRKMTNKWSSTEVIASVYVSAWPCEMVSWLSLSRH